MTVKYTRFGEDVYTQRSIIVCRDDETSHWYANVIYADAKGIMLCKIQEGDTPQAFAQVLYEFGFPPEQELIWNDRLLV